MKNMATNISGLKVYNQMFKCFNCGRMSVSLRNDSLLRKNVLENSVEDEELDNKEILDDLKELNEEWLASCSYCDWSDT